MNNLAVLNSYGDFVDRMLDGYKSKETKRKYKRYILKFFNVNNTWEVKMDYLRTINLTQAKNYLLDMIKDNKSATDIKSTRSALSSLWDEVIAEYEGEIITTNPWENKIIRKLLKNNLPKMNKQNKVKILSKEEIHKVLEHTKEKNYRDYLLIRIVLNCGLRRSEVKDNLKWDNIYQFNNEWFLRIGEDSSKGRKERSVYLPDELVVELQNFDIDKLRVSGDRINTIVKTRFKEIGIDNVTAHQMRHNKITHTIMDGGTIEETQEFAGHNSITTTRGYFHLVNKHKNNAGKKVIF